MFISSTSEDLKDHRAAARAAVLAAGLQPVGMEDFPASGQEPLTVCLDRVAPCAVVVVVVAERYGWVPTDQPCPKSEKSITWLECEYAKDRGKDVLAFLAEKPWPAELSEAYRVTAAIEKGTDSPELLEEVKRNRTKLDEFRQWLDTTYTRATFTTPDNLRAKVSAALSNWLNDHPEFRPPRRRWDDKPYLEWLREENGRIKIQGLGMGAGLAHSFPIEDLYVPLTTPGERGLREPVHLEEALVHPRLVIVGDPGSGKTTFLRRMTFVKADAALRGERTGFPLPVRIAGLIEHIDGCIREGGRTADSHEWLAHFLGTLSAKHGWGLGEEFFAAKLDSGEAVVFLDGLDEAPDAGRRAQAARLFENATKEYKDARFVVTTRPQSYSGRAVLKDFHEARIEPLSDAGINTFLDHWCRGLFPDSERKAAEHRKELGDALRARPEIRRMSRNPVMLTALAVVHWNERRIPEQRADLYESILTWLSRQREKKPGRERADRCLTLLEVLALAMQNEGRKSVPLDWAANALAAEFGGASEKERTERALQFVEEESADSGIIVSRGGEVEFWHKTFQEFLAARRIAGLGEQEQLMRDGRIRRAEWREVALLLAGTLHTKQSRKKVDDLVSAMLEATGRSLPEQARTAGVVGGMVSDLRPFEYAPADPRYQKLMDAVLGIFDAEKAKTVEFQVRLEAAEALGQAGDPRIGRDSWVRIGDFEIGKYPVTVAEYAQFVEDEGYGDERWWAAGGFGQWSEPREWEEQKAHPNRPVVRVSWYEAKAYCAWRGVRLPADAEWDLAAAGRKGREYPWGKAEPDVTRANYSEGGPGHPTPVGLYPAGATQEGVLDMAGNVWEWVEDWYDEKQTARVLRGGSWSNVTFRLRCGARDRDQPDYWLNNLGFRVAREVSFP